MVLQHCYTMSGSYRRYAIVVLTTVATENHRTTHAIFFLIYGCPMLGTDFLKNRMYFAHRVIYHFSVLFQKWPIVSAP